MPTKRQRRTRVLIGDRLTEEQHQQLVHGILLRGGPSPFPSEASARAAWQLHRDELMAEPRHPGTRCWGFWRYEVGLTPGFWHQIRALSEQHAVWRDHADAAERERIEAAWLCAVPSIAGCCILHGRDLLEVVRTSRIPLEFAERHVPAALAEAEAERREGVSLR